MRAKTLFTSIVLSVIALLSFTCSLAPTAGTETGNPDITACLSHAFNVFSPQQQKIPSDYLPEGEEQLNPLRVYVKPQPVTIAKKLSGSDENDPSSNLESTLVDTLVIKDTMFITDTVVVERPGVETINDNESWEEMKGTVTIESIYYDSLFIVDTVITFDTVIINLKQSKSNTDISIADEIIISSIQYGRNADSSYTILNETEVSEPAPSESLKTDNSSYYTVQTNGGSRQLIPEVRTDSCIVSIGRNYTASGLFVVESYYDNDGDGYLALSGSDQKCLAIITYNETSAKCDLEVVFDAGSDMKFSTTADNRIEALYLGKTVGETIVESVRYGDKYFGVHDDTVFMVHNKQRVTDGNYGSRSETMFLKGEDPEDHRNNMIISYKEKVFFNEVELKNAEYSVTPTKPVLVGDGFSNAPIMITIDFGKGLTGIVEGVLNYNLKTITGTYAIAGNEYSMEFKVGMEKPLLIPIEE